MSFRVLHPGTFSLLVDAGRPRSRSLGIPLGGAADTDAFRIGNALVGNRTDAVALEITLSGPVLQAENDVSVCLFGAAFAMSTNREPVPAARVFQIRAGDAVRIGGVNRGARAYFCVRGGFRTRSILGSGSSFSPLVEGDALVCEPSAGSGRSLAATDALTLLEEPVKVDALRAMAGPQADWFPSHRFYQQTFVVSPASNRMGIRLQGEALARQPREMVSEAVAPGAVQITNEGLPIVLGVDGQTIGGYPKIAHVIRADLDRIAQFRPGQSLRFLRVTLDEAEALAERRRQKLRQWVTALRLSCE
jgi:biotin-dependent carboxylase-like uncharacterized protein